MRHISFDESTVMKEFIRIAQEQGLVKTAEPQPRDMPPATPGKSLTPPEIKTGPMHTFDEQLKNFKAVSALSAGSKADGSAVLTEVTSPEFKRFTTGWLSSSDVTGQKKMLELSGKVMGFLKQLGAQLQKMPKNFQETYLPQVQEAMQLLGKKASTNSTIKQADGKLYDVSGETGKDLVDEAHPGGGTRTELTHSKTDENLVETIVEQQEADVEVAKSVPKGTYANLKGLYNALSKMGFEKHLGELKELIAMTATTEDVVEDTLVMLADQLDSLGYTKQANVVDELFKKKVIVAATEEETAEQNIQNHRALEAQLANTFVQVISPNLPNPSSVWANSVVKAMEAAAPQGYQAVLNVLAPHMKGGYGKYVSDAVNAAQSDPAIAQLQASVNEAAGKLQSSAPSESAAAPAQVAGEKPVPAKPKVGPAAQKAHQSNLAQIAQMIGADPKSQTFWQRLKQLKVWTPGDKQPSSAVLRKVQLESKNIPAEWKGTPAAPQQPQSAVPPPPPPPPAPPTGAATPQTPAAPAPAAPQAQPMTYQQQKTRTDKELADKREELRKTIYDPKRRGPAGSPTAF